MAAVASAADQASGLFQKLSMDSVAQTAKPHHGADVKKKVSTLQNVSANGEATNVPVLAERSLTPILPENMDSSMFYVPSAYSSAAYYYGGYDGSACEWDYTGYANIDGVEMQPGIYGDMYHQLYGYTPYGPYNLNGSSVPTIGPDGQLYGPQQYQYPTPFFQPPPTTNTPQTPSQPSTSQGEVSTSSFADPQPILVVTSKTNSNIISKSNSNGNSGSGNVKPSQSYPSQISNGSFSRGRMPGGTHSTGFQVPQFDSPVTWFDGPLYTNGQHRPAATRSHSFIEHRPAATRSLPSTVSRNSSTTSARSQNQHPLPHPMGMHGPRPTTRMGPAIMNRMFPNNQFYGQSGNSLGSGFGFRSNGYSYSTNGCWGLMDSKYKPSGRGSGFSSYGNENQDGFCEQIRGPRAGHLKNQKVVGPNVTIAAKGQNFSSSGSESSIVTPDKEWYNKADFSDKYTDAKFFIIKSYSEDDVHKSIKYNVWASTPNGSKKLDAAYQEAQGKSGGYPVFLFFSVNTSGQFVGVAEMVGPVDFNKTVEYWQQDKWNGCFPVKWHIIKDVPNSNLKHITLENNDNKPVTNSRDTQEVKLVQGLQMLKIFKKHDNKTSILDDFAFYENREKILREKKMKQQLNKQALGGRTSDAVAIVKENQGANVKPKLQVPWESVLIFGKDPAQGSLGERNLCDENSTSEAACVSVKVSSPPAGNHTTTNTVADGF